MDASFDAYGAGWGDDGDRSVLATQRKNDLDKVPIPANVNDLCKIIQGEENYVIGAHKFTTVRLIARVDEIKDVDGSSQIVYDVTEPDEGATNRFRIIQYYGVDGKSSQTEIFEKGRLIHALGRLRSFDDKLSLVAFQVRGIEQQEEVDAFQLEAKLAKIFYGVKNIPDRLLSGEMAPFKGTLFSMDLPERNKPTDSSQMPPPGRGQTTHRPSANLGPTPAKKLQTLSLDTSNRGLGGQKARIYELLKTSSDEQGLDTNTIKQSLRNVTPRFEQDLMEMVDDGVIYQTVDDQHFAAV